MAQQVNLNNDCQNEAADNLAATAVLSENIVRDAASEENVQAVPDTPVRVQVIDLSPLPSAQLKNRKRKAKRSELLSSSPFKQQLVEKMSNVNKRAPRSNNKARKLALPQKNNDCLCIFCEELYAEPLTEDWIQCCTCSKRCHESCSNYSGVRKFTCDLCS